MKSWRGFWREALWRWRAALFSTAAPCQAPTFHEIIQPEVDRGRMAGAAASWSRPTRCWHFRWSATRISSRRSRWPAITLYWIASTSKPFTATAVMMLVDEGKVRLDDPVAKYLPEFGPKPLRAITVRMLLNQTSGLRYYADPAAPTPTDCCALADLVKRFVSLPLEHEPGRKFAYRMPDPTRPRVSSEVVSARNSRPSSPNGCSNRSA
jgi:CubicO group peptidase (beta-lactamase class C family)